HVRSVTPTRSPVATSTVTPGDPSLEATLNQPVEPAFSLVEIATKGSVVSTTRTVNVSVSPSPPESTTEHVTVVSPTGKVEPEVWLQVGFGSGSSSTSVAVTLKVAAPPSGDVASTTTGDEGTVRTGGRLAGAIVRASTSPLPR